MNISDVLVHTKSKMNSGQRQAVEQTLREVDGVIAPRFVPNKDQFIIVAYDPEKVQTIGIRDAFNRIGVEASFVGM
jgi:hypothetical protein